MENKPSVDSGLLAPMILGGLSVMGILVVFFVWRSNAMRPTGEAVSTETPFRYIYLGTEPGLSTLTPEPTWTPIILEPAPTEDALVTLPPLTSGPSNPDFPTLPPVRTPTATASVTLQAVLSKFDDTYFEILYDGAWTGQTNVTDTYQNTLHISFETGNYALFTFVGQQIIVTYQAGPSLGNVLINLDGLEYEVSQSNSETTLVDWRSPILILGTHQITIEHLSGGSINLDSLTIPDLSSTATPTSTVTLTPTP